MKKLLIGLLAVSVIFEAVLFVIFSETGNGWLLPYVNRSLTSNVEGVRIELTRLRIHPSSLMAIAKINDIAEVKLQGPVSWITKEFDIAYKIDSGHFKTRGVALKKPMHIKGRAKGNLKTMEINGSGEAFGAPLTYALSLVEENMKNIRLQMNEANVRDILVFAGEDVPYADGLLSADINMPDIDTAQAGGTTKIKISQGLLYAGAFNKEYNLSLPQNVTFHADMEANANVNTIVLGGDVVSNLAQLKLSGAVYDLKTQSFKTGYNLAAADLSQLKAMLPLALHGALELEGNAQYEEKKLSLTGMTRSLGGQSTFTLQDDMFNLLFEGVQPQKLCSLFGQPEYLGGTLDGNAAFKNFSKPVGTFMMHSKGEADRAVVKNKLDIDLGEHFVYEGTLSGEMKNEKVVAKSSWKTTMGTLNLANILYDINLTSLQGDYKIAIPDLGKLEPLTGRRFRGDMAFLGKFVNERVLTVTGKGKEFGGTVDFTLKGQKLNAHAKGVTVSKLMYMFVYPQVIEALSEATLVYDLSTKRGKMDATLDGARILPNHLTRLINQLLNLDLAKERYNNSKFLAKMTPKKIDFSLDASNKNSYIKIPRGVLYKKSEKINMEVDVNIGGKDLQATVTGTLDNPSVKLDTSDFLKHKLDKKMDKLFDSKKSNGTAIKGLLKGILK